MEEIPKCCSLIWGQAIGIDLTEKKKNKDELYNAKFTGRKEPRTKTGKLASTQKQKRILEACKKGRDTYGTSKVLKTSKLELFQDTLLTNHVDLNKYASELAKVSDILF